jgi:spore germination cell wall hydrolase CwlJ-like protein
MSNLTLVRVLIAVIACVVFMTTRVEAQLTAAEKCHVENIYHEARGESWSGWALVKATVENRVKDSRWPSTVCEVVHQPNQFSWTVNPNEVTDMDSWNRIVIFVKEGSHSDFAGATHYHTTSINPWWASSYEYLGTMGSHKYYK